MKGSIVTRPSGRTGIGGEALSVRRRLFGLPLAIALSMAAGAAPAADPPAQTTPSADQGRIRHYNTLGKTGLKVSDIGFGAGTVTQAALVEYALDLGINYFDAAESYARGGCERAIGEVAARRRGEMVICTKLDLDGNATKESIITRLDGCLERLKTSYVDILMIHGGNPDAVANPAVYVAFDELKKQGKIRFTGISHHGPNLAAELRPVIDAGRMDVILCSYDPYGDPDIPAMLEEARKKEIGLVAMKILTSARADSLAEFKSGKHPFHIAALRWALKESGMDTALISFTMMDQIDEFIQASGAALD